MLKLLKRSGVLVLLALLACSAENSLRLELTVPDAQWLAYHDGLRWRSLPAALGQWRLAAPQGHYAVALLCLTEPTAAATLHLWQQTLNEANALHWRCDNRPAQGARYRLSGEVRGLAAQTSLLVVAGNANDRVAAPRESYSLMLTPGRYDLLAQPLGEREGIPQRLWLRYDLDIRQATVQPIDLAQAVPLQEQQLMLANVQAEEQLRAFVNLRSPRGSALTLGVWEDSEPSRLRYAAVPAEQLGAGHHQAVVEALAQDASSPRQQLRRSSYAFRHTEADVLALPAGFAAVRLEHSAFPNIIWDYPATADDTMGDGVMGERLTSYQLHYRQDHIRYNVRISAAWLQAQGLEPSQARYTLPDWTALPDWQARWQLQPDMPLAWSLSVVQRQGSSQDARYRMDEVSVFDITNP